MMRKPPRWRPQPQRAAMLLSQLSTQIGRPMKHRTRLQRLETALQRTDEALTIAVTWIDAEGATVAEIPPAPG